MGYLSALGIRSVEGFGLFLWILIGFRVSVRVLKLQRLPVAEKTYPFEELYIETIIRNPKMVDLFGYR